MDIARWRGINVPIQAPSSVLPTAAGVLKPHSFQPSPNSSTGCWVRSEPLPQAMASGEQYLSQPQQMRSGFFGLTGKGLAMIVDGAEDDTDHSRLAMRTGQIELTGELFRDQVSGNL